MALKSSTERESIDIEQFGLNVLASTIAHEIRNPLQSMRLHLELAIRNGSTPEALMQLSDGLDRIESVVTKVQRLNDQHQLEASDSNLSETIQSALSFLKFWIQRSGINFKEDLADLVVFHDRDLVEQVVINLVNNAIQSCKPGASICLSSFERDGKAVIRVQDTGCGMSEETLLRLGTPFFTTKQNGNGLGVSFCKSVAAVHGGSLKAESKLKEGTTFSFQIPMSSSARNIRKDNLHV